MRRGRGVVVGVATACAGALVLMLGFSATGHARSLEDQTWVWWAGAGVPNSQIERQDGAVQNVVLFAVATCADGSTLTVGAALYGGGPIDSNGNFSYSGPDSDDPTTHVDVHGHFGPNSLTGTYRLTVSASYCGDHPPGDTGVVSFTAECYQGCSSGGGGGGGGGTSLVVPSGKWAVHYPAKFKCGHKMCRSGFFSGPRTQRPLLMGMLPARLVLTPRCATLSCAVDAVVKTNSGKSFKVKVPKRGSSYGVHSVMTTEVSPIRCGRRQVKAKLIFGLTQVGTGQAAKLEVKELLYLDPKSVRPRECLRTELASEIGYRSTTTTQLP